MRVVELWREAARNFNYGATHGIIAFLAFLAIVLCLGGVGVRGVAGVATEAAEFRESGASVFRIDSPGAIDPAACDALARVEGVEAAGATRSGEALRFASLPDLPAPYLDVTAGMADLVGVVPAVPEAGLIVDAGLGASLGLGPVPAGTYLASGATPVPVAGTFEHPDDGRDATLSGAALGIATDRGTFDSCWVRFWPPTTNPLELLSIPVTGSHGTSEAVQWNPSRGRTFNPQEAFEALPLTALALAAAAIAAVLALTNVRLRRLELASARHVGVTGPDLVGIALAETALWLVPGCAFALTALAFLAAWQNPDPFLAAWAAGARVVVAAAAAWWMTAGVATALIRETHLVRYFQQR